MRIAGIRHVALRVFDLDEAAAGVDGGAVPAQVAAAQAHGDAQQSGARSGRR